MDVLQCVFSFSFFVGFYGRCCMRSGDDGVSRRLFFCCNIKRPIRLELHTPECQNVLIILRLFFVPDSFGEVC